MKSRLPLILLGFVIFATALLTLFAARSLSQDERVAQRQIDERLDKASRTAVSLVQARLLGELDQVRNAMADAVAAGDDLRRVRAMATHLERSRALVGNIYLFMNPWGFVWPADPPPTPEESHGRQELLTTLRNLAATAASPTDLLAFNLDERAYLFTATEGRKVLYVGYAVAPAAFADILASALREAEGGGVLLGAEGGGLHLTPGRGTEVGRVVVQDSLGQAHELDSAPAANATPRLVRALPPPMSQVHILAYEEQSDDIRRTVSVRNQLYRWGLVLLAFGIIGGAVLLVGEARAEVQQARSGSDVALGVSHDLRTPIASMKMLAESIYLGHVPDPARQHEFLRTIMEECERLSQLTERVLFLFRFGQDAVQYRLRPADLELSVRTLLDAFRSRFAVGATGATSTAGPDLRLHVAPPIPRVELDETAFAQVLLNLLDNATKYGKRSAAEGAAATWIDVTVQRCVRRRHVGWPRRVWATVTVRDYGVGVPRRHQRQIFRRFYRIPETRDVNLSGVGLGLSVCRHAMEGHGGWIDVWSAPGEGSAFTLYLPES